MTELFPEPRVYPLSPPRRLPDSQLVISHLLLWRSVLFHFETDKSTMIELLMEHSVSVWILHPPAPSLYLLGVANVNTGTHYK